MVSTSQDAPPTAPPRLYRSSDGRVLAGVARGLADHLGVDVLYVRLAFVLLAAAGGAGVLAYGLFWVFAPQNPYEPDAPRDRERDLTVLLALGSLTVGGLLLLSALGIGLSPAARGAAGRGGRRRRASSGGRPTTTPGPGGARQPAPTGCPAPPGPAPGSRWSSSAAGRSWSVPADLDGTSGGVVAALVVAAGLALVSSPWWVRMARDLTAERSARIREQERAEVAAHVHDSVLHTLTLIQRHVDDPREVTRLARAQERELRGWLYRPQADAAQKLAAAFEQAAAEVEDAHGVAIEVVVVGDCPVDERLAALRDAAREALVNAAKYAEGAPVSLYAEVEPEQVTVFVRDRGPGFDPDAVPADRLGLRQSVRGRMDRNGGSAVVRSSPGDGTEIQLEMPRQTRSAP